MSCRSRSRRDHHRRHNRSKCCRCVEWSNTIRETLSRRGTKRLVLTLPSCDTKREIEDALTALFADARYPNVSDLNLFHAKPRTTTSTLSVTAIEILTRAFPNIQCLTLSHMVLSTESMQTMTQAWTLSMRMLVCVGPFPLVIINGFPNLTVLEQYGTILLCCCCVFGFF